MVKCYNGIEYSDKEKLYNFLVNDAMIPEKAKEIVRNTFDAGKHGIVYRTGRYGIYES